MTQFTSGSFDDRFQHATQNLTANFDAVVSESMNVHFPVNSKPSSSGNWWLDETAELTRQMKPEESRAVADTKGEYIQHIVLPTDTLQGICLAYKVSAMRLKKENGFSGNNIQLGPKILKIPINTNYGMKLQRTATSLSTTHYSESDLRAELSRSHSIEETDISNQKIPVQFSDDKSHYSEDDMLILRDIMHKLKDEMKRADDLDPDERSELEQLLKRLESTISQDDMWKVTNAPGFNESTYDSLRKPLVAAAGGTLVTAGAILVPVPIIPGALVIYAGLSVLATEFEVANQALDKMKEPLKEILAHDEDVVPKRETSESDEDLISWFDLIPRSSINLHFCEQDIDKEFVTMMQLAADSTIVDEFDEATRKAKNEMKRWARNLLNLDTHTDTDNEDSMPKGNQASERKFSVMERFDSLLSSYGEEVDENGVTSDR
jgi:LysM repeat protein